MSQFFHKFIALIPLIMKKKKSKLKKKLMGSNPDYPTVSFSISGAGVLHMRASDLLKSPTVKRQLDVLRKYNS